MKTGSERFDLKTALMVAHDICVLLNPLCMPDRLKICGSIRRGKADVGDIELVFVSREELRRDPDALFGDKLTSLVLDEVDAMLRRGEIVQRFKSDGTATWGEKIRLARHSRSGIPVDFFAANEENWHNLIVCRTGSADNNMRICNAAIERGMKWLPYGSGFADRTTGELVKRCRSEREVYAGCGLPYLEPEQR